MARAVRARRAPEQPPSASDEHRSERNRPGGGNLLAPTSGLLGRRQHCHSDGSPNGRVYRVNISVTSSWASAAISWVESPFILACRLRGFGKLKRHLGRKTDHQVVSRPADQRYSGFVVSLCGICRPAHWSDPLIRFA